MAVKPTKTYTVTSTNPKMASSTAKRLPKYEQGGFVGKASASGKKGISGGGVAVIPVGKGVAVKVGGGAYNVKSGGKRYKGVDKQEVGLQFKRGNTTVGISKNYAPQMLPAAPEVKQVFAEERMTSRKPVTSISITRRF